VVIKSPKNDPAFSAVDKNETPDKQARKSMMVKRLSLTKAQTVENLAVEGEEEIPVEENKGMGLKNPAER